MTGEAWPIDASGGAPSYTGAELRHLDSALMLNGTADSFGVRGGRRPGVGMVVAVSALVWSVTAGAFIAYPRNSATQGPYRVDFSAIQYGSYNAPHATFSRRDILSVVIDDAGAGDGSGARQARVVYTAGEASGAPVSPAIPARGTLLATLVVPPTGSPIVIMGTVAVAAGGVLPLLASEMASVTQYPGLTVATTDTGQMFTSWDGEFAPHNDPWHADLAGASSYDYALGASAVTIPGGGPFTRRVPRNRSLEVRAHFPLVDTPAGTGAVVLLSINGITAEGGYQSNSGATSLAAPMTLIGTYEQGNAAPSTITFLVQAYKIGGAARLAGAGIAPVRIQSRIV